MKLGLLLPPLSRSPFTVVLLVLGLLVSGPASASPRYGNNTQEDALNDGDIDTEDIAVRSPFTSLAGATAGRPVLGSASGSAWLSLLGFTRRTIAGEREIGGFVMLGLPLDRFARGGTRVTSPARPEAHALTAMPELTPVAAQDPVFARVTSSTSEQPFDLALTPRLARSCVAAAWRAAGLGADDARLDAIVSRARWSAILPEARLRAVRFEDARLSLDTGTDTSRLRDSAGANVGFEARLTWRFDRLIYADDEPSFERIRLEQRDARARIGAKVLEALFHWQRAALDLRTLPPSQAGTRDEADVRLRLMEAEAALDVLTNGWFAAAGKARRAREYVAPVPVPRGSPGEL